MRATVGRTLGALALAVGLFAAYASPALAADTLTPTPVVRTIPAGGSTTVMKSLHLDGLPARADIIVAIDTTGSMGTPIAQAQADAVNLCNTVQASIPGARFAVMDIEDYPPPGPGAAGDVPYTLRTPLGFTPSCTVFSAAIATMSAVNFSGGDSPEAFNRAFYEAYADGGNPIVLTRDPLASQYLVVLGDAEPHSATAFGACPARPPADFGRDGVAGGGDDLNTTATIAGLNAANIDLLMIRYTTGGVSVTLACYQAMANATGGTAVDASSAPSIGAFIIANAQATPYTVNLQVSAGCQISFTFSPTFPQGPFTGAQTIPFVETITAPTLVGSYTCTITAVMTPGGPTLAVETVTVNVTPGPPATLTLTPPTDTNTAGDTHCVTATVRDSFGNPVPGVTVNFTVSGANTNGGVGVTGPTGVAQFCYIGTVAGLDNITATAVGGTNPSDTATKTWTPAAPFTLVLTPATDTNTVDDQHCVTATVRDRFGNPTPNIIVRFSVAGSVTTSGSATTDANGQATFCYTGPGLPGADVITAYADTNGDSVRQPNEPQGTAAKTWVIPASTEGCKVTYGGRITAANGDKATFGGNAKADGPKGNENYQDHGPAIDMHVKSVDVLAVVCSADGTQASIFGTATIDGSGSFNFRIDLKDLAEPGSSDTYRIRLSNGYDSGVQVLAGGNVQIH